MLQKVSTGHKWNKTFDASLYGKVSKKSGNDLTLLQFEPY